MAQKEEVEIPEIDLEALKEVVKQFTFTIEVTSFTINQASNQIEVNEFEVIVTFAISYVEIPLEEFDLSQIPEELYTYEIGGILDPIGQLIQWLWEQIRAALDALRRAIEGFIRSMIDGLKSWIIATYGTLTTILGKIGSQVESVIKGLHYWFRDVIVEPLESFITAVRDFLIQRFQEIITAVRGWWDEFATGFRTWFEGVWAEAYIFFKESYDGLAKGLNLVSTTLGGYTNAVLRIHEWLTGLPDILADLIHKFWEYLFTLVDTAFKWVTDVALPTIIGFFRWLWDSFVAGVKAVISAIYHGTLTIAQFLTSKVVVPAVAGLIEFAKPLAVPATLPTPIPESPIKLRMETSSPLYALILEHVIIPTINQMTSTFQEIFGAFIDYALTPGVPSFFSATGLFFATVITSQALSRGLWVIFHLLGNALKRVRIDISGALKFLGTGIEGAFIPHIDLGLMFHHIAAEFKDYGDTIGRGLTYGISIWISRPIAMLVNAAIRDIVPIEIPPTPAMIEESRRMIAHGTQPYPPQEYIDFLWRQLAFRGFPSKFAEWYTRKYDILPKQIQDRFGQPRILPTGLMYAIPTASEMARMMVRDIFGPPEAPLKSFLPSMEMRGFHPHTAVLYYLLHFRYPGMERLFQFLCRVSSGLAWAEIPGVPETITYKGINITIGAAGPSPKALAEGMYQAPLGQSINKLRELINIAKLYAKWMDYARFSWIPGFASDSAIMFDTMADIPMRIDARWMYKWMLVSDLELSKIVLARGMHPNWVKRITVGEAMNALMEERTLARGGVLRAFRDGFTTVELLNQTLANLATVTILEEPYVVRFLPSEILLLQLRAKYDRAYDILTDYSRTLIRSVAEYIKPWEDVITHLTTLTSNIATSLGIALTLDITYFELYRPTVRVMYDILTIRRIRILIRWMMYRIMYRFSDGYMTWAEIEALITKLAEHGKLTPEEVALLLDMAKYMYDYYTRSSKARAILRKLGRGVISEEQAVTSLIALGLEEPIARALVEEHSKIYTLSVAALLSYADLIHIPENLIKRKLDFMGVPEDEKPIILEVFGIRPIRTEVARFIRSVLDEFEEGRMTETEAREQLAVAFKKPAEIDWLILAGKMERDAKVKKLKIDTILYKLRRAEISVEEARRKLTALIPVSAVVDALIERELTRIIEEYTLSIATLLSYASIIEIPEEVIKAKLDKLRVPEPDRSIILQVFRIRPIRDELARVARSIIDSYEDAYTTRAQAQEELKEVFKRPTEIQLLLKAADIEKRDKKAREKVRVIIDKLREGRITPNQARQELQRIIVDRELVEYIIDRNTPVSFTTPARIISMMERIPVPDDLLKKALERRGYPSDEIPLWKADGLVAEIEEEIKRIQRVLHRACVRGKITLNQYRNELNQLATFWGEARARFGVEWIIFSPLERRVLIDLAKREIELRKSYEVETVAS